MTRRSLLLLLAAGAAFACGLLAVWGAERLALQQLDGAPPEDRVLKLEQYREGYLWRARTLEGETIPERFAYAKKKLNTTVPYSVWLYPAAAGLFFLGALAALRRDPLRLVLAGGFVWVVCFLTFGTTSLHSWVPPTIQDRYFAMTLVLGVPMLAWLAAAVSSRWRLWLLVWPAALVVAGVEIAHNAPEAGTVYDVRWMQRAIGQIERAANELPDERLVLTPGQTLKLLPWLVEHRPRGVHITSSPLAVHAAQDTPRFPFLMMTETPETAEQLLTKQLLPTLFPELTVDAIRIEPVAASDAKLDDPRRMRLFRLHRLEGEKPVLAEAR